MPVRARTTLPLLPLFRQPRTPPLWRITSSACRQRAAPAPAPASPTHLASLPSCSGGLALSTARRNFAFRGLAAMTNCAAPHEKDGSKDVGDAEWRRRLSAQEYHILREKGTDPVGGKYDDVFDDGEYVCAGCRTPLYLSSMKFACGCGWPGFYDCIPKRVREQPDKDGRRVEIVCNACNGHLGHVFRNEGFRNPPPNERHCVNNTSVVLVPAAPKS